MKHSMSWIKDIDAGKVDFALKDVNFDTLDPNECSTVPPAKRVY